MSEEVKIHDLRDPQVGGEGVVLIVRKGCKYGSAHAGERVRVDERELQNRSTMETCMTEEAYQRLLDEKAKKAAEAEKPKRSAISAIVDEGLAAIQRAAEEKARKKAELEAKAPPAAPESQPPAAASKDKKRK